MDRPRKSMALETRLSKNSSEGFLGLLLVAMPANRPLYANCERIKVSGTFSDVNIAVAASPTNGVSPYRLLRFILPRNAVPYCLAKSLNAFRSARWRFARDKGTFLLTSPWGNMATPGGVE